MKLCWEFLDKLRAFYRSETDDTIVLRYYDNLDDRRGCRGTFDLSTSPCLYCGNYFLAKDGLNSKFCDLECRSKYNDSNRSTKEKLSDGRLKGNGGGQQCKGRTPWNKNTSLEGKASFNCYKNRLSWFVDVRKDVNNDKVLQTTCCICGKWFSPSVERVRDILEFAEKGNGPSWGFYCSVECKNKCPYYGRTLEQIERNDYLNNGKALFSEIVPTPLNVLHYDWQAELKKLQEPMILRRERLLKTQKMRRRKQTESEKARAERKRERNAIRKDIKTPRLKRMIYLSKAHAKIKNIEFDIDYEWLKNNVPDKCPKCGIDFGYDMRIKMNPFAPSIDRIDPKKGYTKDNCQIVSWIYNCGKNSYEEKDLYIICRAFLERNDHDKDSNTIDE